MNETNLEKIRIHAQEKEEENWEFRAFLRSSVMPSEELDAIVQRLLGRVSPVIDCKSCANCCKEASPYLDRDDIRTLSRHLGITPALLKKKYIANDGDFADYTFKRKPCPFLETNLCAVYVHRPKECASYPHLHKAGFVTRLYNVVDNCPVCPIVWNVFELLKDELHWKRGKA
jgi:Fe-S-cluster containining protein